MGRKQDALEDNATTILADHDTDKDGKLSFAEIVDDREDEQEEIKKIFTEADANSDGFLDLDELPKFVAAMQADDPHPSAIIADHDTDKDGKLSLAEILDDAENEKEPKEAINKFFKEADADGGGLLDADEVPKLVAALRQLPHTAEASG